MKQVASKIKLELAQYRELASFSQFGSDIDADTKARLEHGEILMEILKQPKYQPLKVEEQVMIIYAAINNYLTAIGVANVKEFEREFLEFMASDFPEVGKSIVAEGKLTEETEETLKIAIEKCKDAYLRRKNDTEIITPEV